MGHFQRWFTLCLYVFALQKFGLARGKDVVQSGRYQVKETLTSGAKCQELEIRKSGLRICAEDITICGNKCSGGCVDFTNPKDQTDQKIALDLIGVEKLLLGGSSKKIQCGSLTLDTVKLLAFRVSRVPSKSELDLASNYFGIKLPNVDIEMDVDYFAVLPRLWKRVGSVSQAGDETGTENNQSEDSSSTCFPGSARVRLENGKEIEMRDLQTGNRVQTGVK